MTLPNALIVSSLVLGGALLVNQWEQQIATPPAAPTVQAAPAPQVEVGLPPDHTIAAKPVAKCNAAEVGKCDCFDNGGCKCAGDKQCTKAALRDLTTEETIRLLEKHIGSWTAWVESKHADSELSMRQLMQLWLLENPQHDPRLPRPKATTTPHEFQGSVDAGYDCVVCWEPQNHPNHDWKCDYCKGHGFVKTVAGWSLCPKCRRGQITPTSAPKYTQPAPVAKPKAAPVRYVTHRLEYRPTYGRFGRQTGGQWVYVPIRQPKQYQPQQRYYRSCSNGSCR